MLNEHGDRAEGFQGLTRFIANGCLLFTQRSAFQNGPWGQKLFQGKLNKSKP